MCVCMFLLGLMKVLLWLLHPDPVSRATLTDLERDKWVNQSVDISQYMFESIMEGNKHYTKGLDNNYYCLNTDKGNVREYRFKKV